MASKDDLYSIESFRRGLENLLKWSSEIPRGRLLSVFPNSLDSAAVLWSLGVIDAMTPEERANPSILTESMRVQRISRGAGVSPEEVKSLINQFHAIAKTMADLSTMGFRERLAHVRQIQRGWNPRL